MVVAISSLLIASIFATTIFIIFEGMAKIDQTTVGYVFLGNRLEEEYPDVLSREILIWKNNADYKIVYQEHTLQIDLGLFTFDLQSTINQIERNQQNLAVFSLSQENRMILSDEINGFFTPSELTTAEIDAFIEEISIDLGLLFSRKVYQLEDYLLPIYAQSVLDQATITTINPNDVSSIVSTITSINVPMDARFSLLNTLSQTSLSNEQLSIIASGILGVSGKVNFNGFIFEKNVAMPLWADYGMNVRILRVNQFDLTFYNYAMQNLTIEIEQVDASTLVFKLIGYPQITHYEFEKIEQAIIPFNTLYIADDSINETTENVIIIETDEDFTYRLLQQVGQTGKVVFFNRIIHKSGEAPMTIRIFSEQYLPVNEVFLENVVDKDGE